MKNIALKNDLKGILANPANIKNVGKSEIGDASLDVEYKEPISFDTYTYPNVSERDADLIELQELIKKANEQKEKV